MPRFDLDTDYDIFYRLVWAEAKSDATSVIFDFKDYFPMRRPPHTNLVELALSFPQVCW